MRNTFVRAAAVRKRKPLLDTAETLNEGEIPSIYYHRKYCSVFRITIKKLGESLEDELLISSQKLTKCFSITSDRMFLQTRNSQIDWNDRTTCIVSHVFGCWRNHVIHKEAHQTKSPGRIWRCPPLWKFVRNHQCLHSSCQFDTTSGSQIHNDPSSG